MDLIGIQVSHSQWGIGTIVAHEGICLTVAFPDATKRFIYPAAIGQHIQAVDPDIHAAIVADIQAEARKEVEAAKAAEEAKRAEIEKQIAEANAKKASVKSTSTPKKAAPAQVRIAGKPMTYYVFQGSTFEQEYQGGYLWAPISNKSGDTFHHWDRLLDVRPGDIILHGYNGHVQAVSIARAACYNCLQPKELQTEDAWDLEGRRLDTDYIMLNTPIRTSNYTADIIRLCNTKYAPFNRMGTGNMGYLFEINREMAKIFLDAAATANPCLKGNRTIVEFLAK